MKERANTLGHQIRYIVPLHGDWELIKSLNEIGVIVEHFDQSPYQAVLKWSTEKRAPVIAVNTEQKQEDIEASILHEFGHLLIDSHWLPFQDYDYAMSHGIMNAERFHAKGSSHYQKSEKFINEFIVSFLIPNNELQDLIDHKDCDYIDLLNEIAKRFQVPVRMAKIRLDIFLAVDN